MGPHPHKSNPKEDTSRQGIQGTQRNNGIRIISIKSLQNANTNRHSNRGDDREQTRHNEVLHTIPGEETVGCGGGGESGDAGAQGETFEHLVEEDDDEERDEDGVTGDYERDTEKDGVEDDSGFEDEDGELVLRRDRAGLGVGDHVVVVGQALETGCVVGRVGVCVVHTDVGVWLVRVRFFGGHDGGVVVRGFGVETRLGGGDGAAAPGGEAVAGVLDQEGDEGAGHGDCGGGCFVFEGWETVVGEHEVGMSEEVNEGSSDNNTSSELLNDSKDETGSIHLEYRLEEQRQVDGESGARKHGEN